jgi:uncharacterized membrane protein YfcA
MPEKFILFYALLFAIAFLYASVGHGGGSGYLALMALLGISPFVMHATALTLDLFVSMTSFLLFYKAGHFNLGLFLPLAAASVPAAFLGGLIAPDAAIYKNILGLLLIIIALRFLFFTKVTTGATKKASVYGCLFIGAVIGFASGLIGIGGGIILSPVLLLLGWADQKQTAAVSALFIFVNAAAGLAGLGVKGQVLFDHRIITYILVAFAGGVCGSYFGAVKFRQPLLRNILASILCLAAFKLMYHSG